jgi:DnaJ-domain-containing protein 1
MSDNEKEIRIKLDNLMRFFHENYGSELPNVAPPIQSQINEVLILIRGLNDQKKTQLLNPKNPDKSPLNLLTKIILSSGLLMKPNDPRLSFFDALIEEGADPNVLNKNGMSVLHQVADSKKIPESFFIRLVKNEKIKKSQKTKSPYLGEYTAFQLVCERYKNGENGSENRLKMFIEHGLIEGLFEPPNISSKKMKDFLNKNPMEFIYGYVENAILKNQKLSYYYQFLKNEDKSSDELWVDVIKNTCFITAIENEIYLKDILVESDGFRKVKSELENLLEEDKTKIIDSGLNEEEKQRLINKINSEFETALVETKIEFPPVKINQVFRQRLQNVSNKEELLNVINDIRPDFKKESVDIDYILDLIDKRNTFRISASQKEVVANSITLQMKMIGNCLGLRGMFEPGDGNVVSYEEFNVKKTLPRISEQAESFYNAKLSDSSYTTSEKQVLKEVSEAFSQAKVAQEKTNYEDQAKRYLSGRPVVIPCDFKGHIASLVLHKNRLYFSNKDSGTTVHPGVECYQFDPIKLLGREVKNDSPLSEREIKSLAEKIQAMSTKKRGVSPGSSEQNLGLPELEVLEPEFVYRRKLHGQKQGNCTYTNTKRAFEAVIMALKDDAESSPEIRSINNAKLYHDFAFYDREKSIRDHFDFYNKMNPKDPKLLDPLFNYLKYKTYSINDNSISLAKIIIAELKNPATINMTDKEIWERMRDIPYKPHMSVTNFINVSLDLKEGMFLEEKKEYYSKRSLDIVIPKQRKKSNLLALEQAGLGGDRLNFSVSQPPLKIEASDQETLVATTPDALQVRGNAYLPLATSSRPMNSISNSTELKDKESIDSKKPVHRG